MQFNTTDDQSIKAVKQEKQMKYYKLVNYPGQYTEIKNYTLNTALSGTYD